MKHDDICVICANTLKFFHGSKYDSTIQVYSFIDCLSRRKNKSQGNFRTKIAIEIEQQQKNPSKIPTEVTVFFAL